MEKYRLKLTALTPIHIGTGEVYEPTNFVIDNGYLYEFDEVLFYKSLDDSSKQNFNNSLDDLFRVISFYKKEENIQKAKDIYFDKVSITKELEKRYKNQFNKDGTFNKNQLNIEKNYKTPNTYITTIPGSSIKGAMETFLHTFSKPEVASNEIRQKLKVQDCLAVKVLSEIGIAKRVHKNPSKEAKSKIPINLEIMKEGSQFICTIDTHLDIKSIIKKAQEFYTNKKRINTYFNVANNSFVMRVGKFSGKPFVVYKPENIVNSYGKEVATHTLYGNKEFGWIQVEVIDDNEYEKLYTLYKNLHNEKILEIKNRQKDINSFIENQLQQKKELQKQQELKKQRKLQEEQKQKEVDFKEAKESESVEFLEKFILKYASEDISFYKQRLEELKVKQKENKLQLIEENAQKMYNEAMKKKGSKGFDKARKNFIKKYSKKSEHKNSEFILGLVEKLK